MFDKTGTITSNSNNLIEYDGIELTESEKELLCSSLRASNHPLSRMLYKELNKHQILTLDEFQETIGAGICAQFNNQTIKIGAPNFVYTDRIKAPVKNVNTEVHISTNEVYKGFYNIKNRYREGLDSMISDLNKENLKLSLISGDNESEKEYLKTVFPQNSELKFNQKPHNKLVYIESLQNKNENVLMLGDGLNDSGALAQSNVGVVLSENINSFSPAADAILDSKALDLLPNFLKLSKKAIRIIKFSLIFSLIYNLIGIGFAVTGHLAPVVAAILMPLSSISVVVFTTIATHWSSRKLLGKI